MKKPWETFSHVILEMDGPMILILPLERESKEERREMGVEKTRGKEGKWYISWEGGCVMCLAGGSHGWVGPVLLKTAYVITDLKVYLLFVNAVGKRAPLPC